MGFTKRLLEEQEANRAWAANLLTEAGALKACDYHEYLLDQLDPQAVEDAAEEASKAPPDGMTPEEAAEFVRGAINDYGEECPGCASWKND